PPTSTLFPYTTLFRSSRRRSAILPSILPETFGDNKGVGVQTSFHQWNERFVGHRSSELYRANSLFRDNRPCWCLYHDRFNREPLDRKSTRLNSSHSQI